MEKQLVMEQISDILKNYEGMIVSCRSLKEIERDVYDFLRKIGAEDISVKVQTMLEKLIEEDPTFNVNELTDYEKRKLENAIDVDIKFKPKKAVNNVVN